MRIPPAQLDELRAGTADLAFRRWERPRVRVGTRLRTQVGVLEVLDVARYEVTALTEQDARRAAAGSLADLRAFLDRRADRPLFRVELRHVGEDPRTALRDDAELDDAQRSELDARLARMDRAAHGGPWTRAVLELVRDRPTVRAPDLAAGLGVETQPFKRDVRKLKELGLTESLAVGYRLSPRGRAYLAGAGGAPR